ncbi:MAG: DUF2334 domain-containing protein [Armatimonadota bacterium]
MTAPAPIPAKALPLLLPLLLLLCAPATAEGVLLLHDAGPTPAPDEAQAIAWTRDLLGHFDLDITIADVHDYSTSDVADRDAIIYLGLRPGAALPERLLGDCARARAPVCWIGANIEQLLQASSSRRLGFSVQAASSDLRPAKVAYESSSYWRDELPLPLITITAPEACRLVASVGVGGERYPYAVRQGEFWYFPELPIRPARTPGAHLILCDQMHEVLQQPHDVERAALLLIADVNPTTDAGKLSALVRQLQAEGVPFAIEVAAVDPATALGDKDNLTRRRGLVSVLRGAQRTGAAIVAYLPDQDQESATLPALAERANQTLNELSRCGLYPVAWNVSRQAYDDQDSASLARLCSTVLDRTGDRQEFEPLPFLIERSADGQRVMPHNLPSLARGGGEVEAVLEAARRQALVADPWLTVRVAVGAPPDALSLLVDALHDLDFAFRDLRFEDNRTSGDSLHVTTVASQRKLEEVAPRGWSALVLGPESDRRLEVERIGARSGDTIVRPGAIVVSHRGPRPKVVISFEGDAQQVTERGVHGLARLIVIAAIAAVALLFLIYLAQLAQRRGR